MALLYADEDFSQPVIALLRQYGHDVLTAYEAGQANQGVPDADVLIFAADSGRSLLTFNRRHFIRLHSQTPQHAGIIACSRDNNAAALAHRIHESLTKTVSLQNQLVRVNRPE